jgi:hypothetical protein
VDEGADGEEQKSEGSDAVVQLLGAGGDGDGPADLWKTRGRGEEGGLEK